jgi:hypothetical protein
MANNIQPLNPGQNIVPVAGTSGIINRFAQVAEVAQPTLDAVATLRAARAWLTDRPSLADDDEADAKARLALIPDAAFLQQAAQLFDDAVRKAAPEPWYHLVISSMLAGMPNAKNVAADYSYAVVDTILHDDEAWESGCEAGFSAPIFVCAIRQVRREEEFVPSAAKILKACQDHRKRFKQLGFEVEMLMTVRENAEKALLPVERDDFSDVPF